MKTVQVLVTVGIQDPAYAPLAASGPVHQAVFEDLIADSIEKGARLQFAAKWPSGCSFDVQAVVDGRRES